ncbi:MAG: alpha/beta hydrolase [Bacillaceae bacterium]|nr:alpha/beta hydrolase [Bacillaceae bacterium]
MPTVRLNDIPIYYEDTGSGFPITCIHGLGLSHKNWIEQVNRFSRDYRIITYDLRGHGKSGISAKNTTTPRDYLDQLTLDLRALLCHLNVKQTILLGYSMGSLIALNYMYFYPSQVTGAVLSGVYPRVGINPSLWGRLGASHLLNKLGMRGLLEYGAAFTNSRSIRQFKLFLHEARRSSSSEMTYFLTSNLYIDLTQKIKQIKRPVLHVYGTGEKYMMRYRHQLLTIHPYSEVALIPGSNHACPTRAADVFNQLVADHLHRLNPDHTSFSPSFSNSDQNQRHTEQDQHQFT